MIILLTLSCPGFFRSFSARRVFGTTQCNSFIWPSINLKLGTSIGMSKKYSHTKIIELFLEMTSQWRHFPFFQLLCFSSDFAQILYRDASWYNKQKYKILLKLIEKWRHNDVITDSEDSMCQEYPSKNVLPWQYEALYSGKILYRGINYHFQAQSKILWRLIKEQCHSDVITELDGLISHKC